MFPKNIKRIQGNSEDSNSPTKTNPNTAGNTARNKIQKQIPKAPSKPVNSFKKHQI